MKSIIITFRDSRDEVYAKRISYIANYSNKLEKSLTEEGVELIKSDKPFCSINSIKKEIEKIQKIGVDSIILHVPTWVDPINVIAANTIADKYNLKTIVVGNNYNESGSLGVSLVISGALRAAGIRNYKINFNYKDKNGIRFILAFLKAASVFRNIRGMVCGRIGGKALGIYTADVDEAQILKQFGIIIQDIDQLRLVQDTSKISEKDVEEQFYWLKKYCGLISYDGNILTEEKLKQQCRSYLVLKRVVEEEKYDLIGLRCQPELSDRVVNQCIGAALMNDSYDAKGEKKIIPCACESDIDGAITMLILSKLSKKPVAFGDFRIIEMYKGKTIWTICNCGAMATWFAGKSKDFRENLKNIHLLPQVQGKAGGAATQFIVKAGEMTWARLGRVNREYVMTITKKKAIELPRSYLHKSKWEWPHAFLEMDVSDLDVFMEKWPCNHTCGVYGDYIEELKLFCEMSNIKPIVL
ncbi:MAG: hypothetical protein KAW87_06530 [Candidatus Cloacimonetes bacterium]|nr:hypothetical protein [Candidatus Cloacimonadota bacterium]